MKKLSIKTLINPYTIIILAIFVFYGRLLFGEMLYTGDVLAYQLPEKMVIRECLEKGRLPLMNPYILSGSPMLNNIAVASLYPLNFLLLFGSPEFGFNLYIFTHILLAGIAFYLLLSKGFRISEGVSCLGSVSFALSGPIWFSIDKGFITSSWLIPLFLLGIIRQFSVSDSRKRTLSIIPVISLALLFYCGNFLEAYSAVIVAGIGIISYHLWIDKNELKNRELLIIISKYCVIVIFSVLLAAPQIFPTYIASKKSYRADGLELREAQNWSLPPIRATEYLIPFFFGARSETGFHFGKNAYTPLSHLKTEGSSPWFDSLFLGLPVFCGILISISAIISGILSKNFDKNRKISAFLVSGALLFFLISLGKRFPLYMILYHILPKFKVFRHPEKFIEWVNILLILIGAFGLEKFVLQNGEKGKANFKKVIYGVVFLIFISIASVAVAKYYGSMDNELLFRWQLKTSSISILAIGFIALTFSFYKNRVKSLTYSFVAIAALQMIAYSFIIKWTIPQKEFQNTKVWTESLPDFDKSQWRIFTSNSFDFNGDKFFRGNFERNKMQEYINLEYNSPAIKKIRTPAGFDAVAEKEYIEIFNFRKHSSKKLMDIFSVKYLGSGFSFNAETPKGYKKVKTDNEGSMILENPDAVPRISLYKNFIFEGIGEDPVFNTQYNPKETFILTSVPKFFPIEGNELSCGKNPNLNVLEDSPGKITIEITGGPAWVVIRDWHAKGWECRDENGNNVPIGQADGCFMAVFADKASKTIDFRFTPPGFNSGLITAGFAFLFLIGFLNYKTIIREK